MVFTILMKGTYGSQYQRNEKVKIADTVDVSKWYFCHFHEDTEIESVSFCLYDEIVEID